MDENELEPLKETRDYYDEWLKRFVDAHEIAPTVQINRDMIDWQIRALQDAPPEIDYIFPADLTDQFQQNYGRVIETLPMMPDYNRNAFVTASGLGTASFADTYNPIIRAGQEPGRPQQYSRQYLEEYKNLREKQKYPDDVRQLIYEKFKISQDALNRFDRAQKAYNQFRIGIGERTSAAGEMRTLLDGIQGDLMNLARNHPKENAPSWSLMAQRLTGRGTDSVECKRFAKQEEVRRNLKDEFSEVLKDREGSTAFDITLLWFELLDHIYTVLSLIR